MSEVQKTIRVHFPDQWVTKYQWRLAA